MSGKALNTLLSIAGAGLGAAGLILILLSVFAEKNTLTRGLLCVATGGMYGCCGAKEHHKDCLMTKWLPKETSTCSTFLFRAPIV